MTLVALADGTARLYFSNGGGTIGAGPHDRRRAAAESFVDAAEAYRPPRLRRRAWDRVRFYARTFSGTMTAEADEQDLGDGRHPLAPVFTSVSE